MLKPDDRHLTDEELDSMSRISRTSGHGQETIAGETSENHLFDCPDCLRRLERIIAGNSRLASLQIFTPRSRGELCPDEHEWQKLAAGSADEGISRQMLEHASSCDHCGPLLKETLALLSEESPTAEQEFLSTLESITPEWQAVLARRLAVTSQSLVNPRIETRADGGLAPDLSWWKKAFTIHPLVWVGSLGTILVLGLWLSPRLLVAPDVNQLLANAYTEHRVMEVRIPGAKHSPIRIERSDASSSFNKPGSLLKAEALIAENLKNNPNDPRWLLVKARADLLDGNYDSSIKILEQALEMQADSTEFLTDLASAYFVRGTKNPDRQVDIGSAINYYSRVLVKNPDDLIALFNRALSERALSLYGPEIEDWQRYLKIAPADAWSEEARTHLTAAQEKIRNKQTRVDTPLLDTNQLASADNLSDLDRLIDARLDDYQYRALTDWLPAATSAWPRQSGTNVALAAIARVTSQRHGDIWLSDMIASLNSNSTAAMGELATAVKANEGGDAIAAWNSAHRAVASFRMQGNVPGQLRAQAEEIYADHFLYEGARCREELQQITPLVQRRHYYWLRAQLQLEAFNCYALRGDFGPQQEALEHAIEIARQHGYISLLLRGLGFQADTAASGDPAAGFSLACAALNVFWSTSAQIIDGYNLYTDLDTAADTLRLPFLQVVLWHQATQLVDRHPDLVQRAIAHRWYADAAYLANLPDLARDEYTKAGDLFRSAPPTEATARDEMNADIWLANLEVRSGDLARASVLLHRIEANLTQTHTFPLQMSYYTAKADLSMRTNDAVNTEFSIWSAISLAEWALASYTSHADRRKWTRETNLAYRDLVEWKLRQGDVASALEFWEWYKGAELRSTASIFSNLDLDSASPRVSSDPAPLRIPTDIAKGLRSLHDKVVIAYAILPDGAAVWTFDNRGVVSRRIPISNDSLNALVVRFLRLCASPDSDMPALRSASRSLYEALVSPVEDRLETGRTLVFEPDGLLASLPFEALLNRSGEYLIERAPIEIAPGFYQSRKLRPVSPIHADLPALIVSVPTNADPRVQSFQDAETETDFLASKFRSPRILTGQAATLTAIRHAIRDSRIFHFVGHALDSPERSGLLLNEVDPTSGQPRLIGPDSFSASFLSNLRLAVLSACSSGLEPHPGASGTESLTQILLQAGVPHVVASRWNVDSAATATLMKEFYAHMLAGESTRESLRASELALASQPASTHPYYWAAFGLHGVN